MKANRNLSLSLAVLFLGSFVIGPTTRPGVSRYLGQGNDEPKAIDQEIAGKPTEVKLANGGSKKIDKNKAGQAIRETEYNGLGLKVTVKTIYSLYPNGQEGAVTIVTYGVVKGVAGALKKMEMIKYDKKGAPTKTETLDDFDKGGQPHTKTVTENGETKTYKYSDDGKWILSALLQKPNDGALTSTPPSALPGYKIETGTNSGLYTVSVSTPAGKINVNLTDDLVAGDTVSGTVEEAPTGKNETERAQSQAELNGYVVELEQQQTKVTENTFTRNIPVALTTTDRVIRILRDGREVGRAEVPISAEPKQTPTEFILPTGGQQGRLVEIKGPCDGVFRKTDYVRIGETSVPILAESPRKKVARDTSETVGPSRIECGENDEVAECPFRNLGIKLSADKLSLLKGETTNLQVTVLGLAGITEDVPLDLVNQSPNVISLSGGESQHMIINASAVRETGSYSTDRTLTGIMRGSFGITGAVRWSNVCTHSVVAIIRPGKPVLPKTPREVRKPQLPEITVSYKPQREIFEGKCDGEEVLISVPNGSFTDLVLPKNVGTCPVEIYGLDGPGKELSDTRLRLEPGEQIGSYGAGYLAKRVVFICPEGSEGACRLEVEHNSNKGFDTFIAYTVPRGVLEGKCDGQENVISQANQNEFLDSKELRWIKNVGTCPIKLYSVNAQGQPRDEPLTLEPQKQIQSYSVPWVENNPPQKIVFKCDNKAEGSCNIELDSSSIKTFPLPNDVVLQRTTVTRIIEGKCDGEETIVSAPNGSGQGGLEMVKNVGTCPLMLSVLDAEGNLVNDANGKPIKPVTLQPNNRPQAYSGPLNTWTITMECPKGATEGKCALEIKEREISYTTPKTPDPSKPQKPPDSPRITMKGECARGGGEPVTIAWIKHNLITIKWIKNTGTCPVSIYSVNSSDGSVSKDRIRLEPGQQIEGYNAGAYMNKAQLPEYGERIVFSCKGDSKGTCQIEYSHP